MTPFERAGLALMHRFDPETAHGLSIRALRAGLAPLPGPVSSARLATELAGLALPNPVGRPSGVRGEAKAGLSFARPSSDVSGRGPSSWVMVRRVTFTVPVAKSGTRSKTSTGQISAANSPACCAANALVCEASANAS